LSGIHRRRQGQYAQIIHMNRGASGWRLRGACNCERSCSEKKFTHENPPVPKLCHSPRPAFD
jgi:hypothetical protein